MVIEIKGNIAHRMSTSNFQWRHDGLDAVDVAAWRVPGGGGVYKISYNIIISYRIFSD